jgi:ribonuclease HI
MAMKNAYTDGACRGGNPGFTSCAWVLYDSAMEGQEVSGGKYLGPERHTNNYAEYQGLILLLEHLYFSGTRNVIIHSDSELVVNQTLGNWTINQDDLRLFAAKCYGLLTQGCHVLKHIKGHNGDRGNERADALCNAILDIHKEEYEQPIKT